MSKIVLLDAFPTNLKTTETKDYISKCILTYLHEPMFYKKENIYLSHYIKDSLENNFLILEINDFFWSNGEKMTVNDIYNSLFFILEEKKSAAYYLNFISGVEEYLDGKKEIHEIGISIKDNKLFCLLNNTKCNYRKIFSLIQYSPLYIRNNKVNWEITSGRYVIQKSKIKNCIKLKKNPFFIQKINEFLTFKIIKDPDLAIKYFLENSNVLMTCSTSFPFNKIKKYVNSEIFFRSKSNIRIFFKLEKNLMRIKEELLSHLKYKISKDSMIKDGISLNFNYLSSQSFQENQINISKDPFPEKVRILFADFYPNSIIIKHLSSYFKEVELIPKNSMKEFIKSYEERNYDVSLLLTSTFLVEDLNWLEYFIYSIDENLQQEYADLVNKNYNDKKFNIIESFLLKNSNLISVGMINHLLLKRGNGACWVDSNDVIQNEL